MKRDLLIVASLFFLWIIYLRMEKDAETANVASTQNKTKQKNITKLIDKNAKM